ncbi:MAG: type II CRISPR RNA-guided endonuclease Cas9 [Dehalococcoidia bacterium]|nr:type II CRISPR RNA-guided endonuclease Cas9 [Dehalococcoidia bacterium]
MGTNSIGWAAIKLDDDGQPCGILDMGVRNFPDGRNPTDKQSNAVNRRLARGQRRRRDRYLKRREDLINALVEYGLMPEDAEERKKIANDNKLFDPYKLRAKALDEPLDPFELGRAIFHLDQRRGFKSNRKSDGDNENEAQKTRSDINELRRRMDESGARTLGEFLVRRRRRGKSVRARPDMGLYPDRAMYEKEFDKIRAAQEPHQDLSTEQWDRLRNYIIFYQRDLRPVDPGWCLFEDGEKRAAKALPLFQEFRMLQEVNNLKIQVGREDRALKPDERERVLNRLRSGSDVNLKKPVRALGLPSGAEFNLAQAGRTMVKGDEATARLTALPKKATANRPATPGLFGKKWLDFSLDERNEIARFLIETESPEIVRERALTEWGLSEAQADALSNVSLVSGYGNLSEKAIAKILPHMERGLRYSDAVIAAGYPHHSDLRNDEAHERLPYYGQVLTSDAVGANREKNPEIDGEPARYGRIANPTVHIGLGQLRRVVNRIIEVHGKPEEMVIELARDLKMNKEDKLNYQRSQRDGAERNERFRKDLESAEEEVSPEILRKLRLWEEQGPPQARICPYTGRQLSFEMVISARTEIDHILPFSRTLHNSMNNLVVCMAEANRAKGDRSPYEAFGHNPPGYDYDDILANVERFPYNKRRRFQPDAMEWFENDDAFLDRQLNETQYLSRTARTYLSHLYNEKAEGSKQRVRAIPGRMTALLRRGWGLNGILSESGEDQTERKQRDDHRHHAIDAFIVANTTQRLLHRFARAAGSSWQDAAENLARLTPKPWDGFDRNDLKPFLEKIVVSYKTDRGTRGVKGKTTGQLHNDTAYGIIELVEGGPSKLKRRKVLSGIDKVGPLEKTLNDILDPPLKKALIDLWDRVKAEGGKSAEFASQAAKGVMVNGRPQKVRSVRVEEAETIAPIKDSAGKVYKGYKLDGNEFVDVWQMGDKNKSWKIVVVPTFYANQSDFNIEDFRPKTSRGRYRGKPDPNAKHLIRLYKDDMGALGKGDDLRIVRVRKFGDGYVVLDDHNEADVDGRERLNTDDPRKIKRNNGHSGIRLHEQDFRKIRVDEIGRVHDPGPFKP